MKLLSKVLAMIMPTPVIEPETDDDAPSQSTMEAHDDADDQSAMARVTEILTCEEARGRTKLTQYLVLQTSITAAIARIVLTGAPCEDGADLVRDTACTAQSEKAAAQLRRDADFLSAYRRADYAIVEPAKEPATVIDRMTRNYAIARGEKPPARTEA